MEKKLNQYIVECIPQKQIPKDGWDSALKRVQLIVNAPTAKEAREQAVHIMESHGLYVKPVLCEKGQPKIRVTARLKADGHYFIETMKAGNKTVSLEDCKKFTDEIKESMDRSMKRWKESYKEEK